MSAAPLQRARQVFAEALAAELDVDMTPEFMIYVDKILARMYLMGVMLSDPA